MLYNNSTLFEVPIYLVSLAQLAAAHHRREKIADSCRFFFTLPRSLSNPQTFPGFPSCDWSAGARLELVDEDSDESGVVSGHQDFAADTGQ